MKRYTADFETTTLADDCRVWAWGLFDIDTGDFLHGTELSAFFDVFKNESMTVYFHNLKFDGEFILSWLFRNGYEWREDKKQLTTNTFTTLISDTGQWYTMTICLKRNVYHSVYLTINDSMKLLPMSVEKIAKAFKLNIEKLDIDYNKLRPVGYQLQQKEIDYLKNDVEIIARALQQLFVQNMKSITIGANALKDYKKLTGSRQFDYMFPAPDYDSDIRKSYRGGFTYLNKRYANIETGKGVVLDVNSLYPFVMRNKPMPIGDGIFFDGQYKQDPLCPLYVQMLKCQFELKPDHIPTIQIKNVSVYFNPVEYVTSSGYEEVTLCLTSIDLKLFFEQYNVYNIEYISGWKFAQANGLFNDYIDKWTTEKINAKTENNPGMYTISKLMLNSLYGKFATNPNVRSKIPVYSDDQIFLVNGEKEKRKPVYIPVGTFITAYAREHTIRAAQSVFNRFIYADTDSLHLEGTNLPDNLFIHPVELGAWDHEFTFDKGFFIRAKSYIEYGRKPGYFKKQLKITCAGLPESCHDQVTFDNFRQGMTYTNKLRPKRVSGGVILENCNFRISQL